MSDILGGLGAIMALIGAPLIPVGWVWLAVLGFRENPLWGLMLTMFPTFAAPCFALDRWKESRIPVLLHYGGVFLCVVGMSLIPWSH